MQAQKEEEQPTAERTAGQLVEAMLHCSFTTKGYELVEATLQYITVVDSKAQHHTACRRRESRSSSQQITASHRVQAQTEKEQLAAERDAAGQPEVTNEVNKLKAAADEEARKQALLDKELATLQAQADALTKQRAELDQDIAERQRNRDSSEQERVRPLPLYDTARGAGPGHCRAAAQPRQQRAGAGASFPTAKGYDNRTPICTSFD